MGYDTSGMMLSTSVCASSFLMNILILTKVRIISTKNNLQSTFPELELIKEEEER